MTTESTSADDATRRDGSRLSEGLGAALPVATLVEVLPTKVWADKDWMGTVSIWRQHEGDKPFKFIDIHYNYAHTSNAHQHALAQQILDFLGGGENRAERSNSAAPLGVGWNEGLARSLEKRHNLGSKNDDESEDRTGAEAYARGGRGATQ